MSPQKKLFTVVLLVAIGAGLGYGAARWTTGPSPAVGGQGASSQPPADDRKVLYWYDPMVPQHKFDKPGKSPFMDMQLVPKYAGEADASGVAVDPRVAQMLGVRTATAEKQRIGASVQVPATVQLNERDVAILQARTAGFVQRVARLAPGDVVAAGAFIAELLVPEWAGAQQEFLALRRMGDAALTAAARQRLVLLGMPTALVQQVERTGEVQALTTVHAPTGGLVQEMMVRPGMTVSQGMSLARITGLSTVWLEAALPEVQAATARVGEPVEVTLAAFPGETLKGKVTSVLPEASSETRTLRVRAELPNPHGRLRAGMFAQMRLGGPAEEALVVPAESVIRTGERAIVYVVEQPGRFTPVPVRIGREWGDKLEVLEGLQAGQQVVASGQFLIDSEASMQGLLQRQAGPSAAPASAAASAGSQGAPSAVVHQGQGRIVGLTPQEVTLDHGPVPSLKWPAMQMGFKIAQPGLADSFKVGDKVQFTFRESAEGYEVTGVQRDPNGGAK
ncbi:efflux RND transporter periplasmic adaptor subunit [Roseateles asaccharophilus]|uniref:Cu(I)/Ag(I) efflux system membrane fusion protein n=1 Tax=Roseateles asaccharophilus TaxID=582607 RepID=A0ABU2ABS5_9BURK|nr:efflux RND transporter periplasmic adaptor subunit [Roseateles asaccharophilus]MDR7334666.1 Cu(I)/Ag(I) efflux system membrane fusion protein [Roseateles asaccharophilus]